MNQHETDQFLRQEDLPAAKMDTLHFRACLFSFSTIQDLLSLDSLELISCPRVDAALCVSKLCPMTALACLLIHLGFPVGVFADFLVVLSMIMQLSITEDACVYACMSTHIHVMMCVSPGLSRMSAPTHHYDSSEPLACRE